MSATSTPATSTPTPAIDIQAILNAVFQAVNSVISAIGQYLPIIATVAAGAAVAFIAIRFGRRLLNKVLGLVGGFV